MKTIEININGTSYPCAPTMGAMLRFKEQTGRELTEIDLQSITDLCTYLWCCVTSASRRENKPFDMSLMDFADSIEPDDLTKWNEALLAQSTGEDQPEAEKKSR